MTHITLIGAGSVEFTRILMADLIEFPELAGSTITLHDINPERLDTAERICRYTIEATGAELQVRAELDRRAALDGAAFVINEIQVGGFEATLRDFEIPKKYGLRQTIGDTIGVGGVFRGLRTIPVLLAIAEDMVELCPSAMLLNREVQRLVREFDSTKKPVFSIGHGAQVLISSQTVRGRQLTGAPSIADDIRNAGGLYRDQPVIQDGNWVTTRSAADMLVFTRAMLEKLATAVPVAPA